MRFVRSGIAVLLVKIVGEGIGTSALRLEALARATILRGNAVQVSFILALRFLGNRSSAPLTPRTLATTKSSRSVTRRCWFSKVVTAFRLTSQQLIEALRQGALGSNPFVFAVCVHVGPMTLAVKASF